MCRKYAARLVSFTIAARVPTPCKGSLRDLQDALREATGPLLLNTRGPDRYGIIRITFAAYEEAVGKVDPEEMIDRVARVIHRFTMRGGGQPCP